MDKNIDDYGYLDNSTDLYEKILASAIQVFYKKSIAKTRMIDIASQAGIGKSTIYEYFTSKRQLIRDAFSYLVFGIVAESKPLEVYSQFDPWEALDRYLDHLYRIAKESPENSLLIQEFASELLLRQSENENIMMMRQEYREAIQPEIDLIKSIIRRGKDIGVFAPIGDAEDTLAFMIMQIAGSLGISSVIDNDRSHIDDVYAYVKKSIYALLQGLDFSHN